MADSVDEYFNIRTRQIERRKKIITIISTLSFFGSMLFAAVPTIQQAIKNPREVVASSEILLKEQAHGYELVLQREPNNQIALEKLSLLRLQLKDVKGSVDILEKLTKQHPERPDYKALLTQMSQKPNQPAH